LFLPGPEVAPPYEELKVHSDITTYTTMNMVTSSFPQYAI